MSPDEKKDEIYNRINYLIDRYSRVLPIYNFINEKLLMKFYKITNFDYGELEQKLNKVESVLKDNNDNEFKINELRQVE